MRRMARRAASVLLTLAGTTIARGETVTYDFVDRSTQALEASLTFDASVASGTSAWSITHGQEGNIVDFRLFDSAIGPTGSYDNNGLIVFDIKSLTGATLDGGSYFAEDVSGNSLTTVASSGSSSELLGKAGDAFGTWQLAATTPEPSSLVLAGLAGAAAIGCAWYRRR